MLDATTGGGKGEDKPWYKKPENIVAFAGIGLLGWGAINILDSALPTINRVLEQVLESIWLTAGVGLTVAILGLLLVNKDLHRLIWYGYKSAMRWITGRFIELDPIGIMQSYVDTLHVRMKEIRQGIATLRGQASQLENLIRATSKQAEKSMQLASQARNREGEAGMRKQLRLQARKAGRAQETNMTYKGLHAKIVRHVAVMEKIKEASEFMIEDMEDTIEHETHKRKAIHASFKAMSAARRILAADEQREMYDRALQSNVDDYHNKLGEITQFMEDSQGFITTMDLENGVFEEDALLKLDEWEKRSEDLMSGGHQEGTKDTRYRVAAPQLPSEAEVEKEAFSDLFNSLDR